MQANGTAKGVIASSFRLCHVSLLPGMRSFMASVTVSVVINVLSAAGSKMVPNTERIWYLRARNPSTFYSIKRISK